jgi:hypothetical protein
MKVVYEQIIEAITKAKSKGLTSVEMTFYVPTLEQRRKLREVGDKLVQTYGLTVNPVVIERQCTSMPCLPSRTEYGIILRISW